MRVKSRMPDFNVSTEIPGAYVTASQMERIHHRYYLAEQYAKGRVLEVACGPGIGIGYAARNATMAVGGDYTANLLQMAMILHEKHIPFIQLDGQQLPFSRGSFDTIFCFEAVYYFPDLLCFITEAHRVLRPGGVLLFNTLNNSRGDFSKMPSGPTFFSISQLRRMLTENGFSTPQFFGAFDLPTPLTGRQQVAASVHHVLSRFDLLPTNVQIRNLMKRMAYGRGRLKPLEMVQEGVSGLEPTLPIEDDDVKNFKFIYVVAMR